MPSPQKLSRLHQSILCHELESIPCVKYPMLHMGMLFSAFAWHDEDNCLYSINFNHLSAAKTWYAVGASHAAGFEKVVLDKVFVAPGQPHPSQKRAPYSSHRQGCHVLARIAHGRGGGCGSRCATTRGVCDHFPRGISRGVQSWIQHRRGSELCHTGLVWEGVLKSPALLYPLTPSHHRSQCKPLQRDGGGNPIR